MNTVLIFRYIKNEGPGYLAEFLDNHAVPHQLVKVSKSEDLPVSLDHVSGLVFMGGTMSVNDDLPWIAPTLDLIRKAHNQGVPVLGHCLGGQLIARALGALITSNPVPEFGWQAVSTCKDAAPDWVKTLPDNFDAFHWHGETFGLPQGAIRILSNDFCSNQGFVIGHTTALQCHIEMTEELIHTWIADAGDSLPDPAPSIQSAEAMTRNLDAQLGQMRVAADILYSQWIENLE